MKIIKSLQKLLRKHSKYEHAFEIIRIFLGMALFLKGIHFIIKPQDLDFWMLQGQINVIETLISHYVISAHLVGGCLLCIGLLTKVAAYFQLPVLIGALGLVHSQESLFSLNQNIELTTLVLFLLTLFSVVGSGHLSLDYYVNNTNPK